MSPNYKIGAEMINDQRIPDGASAVAVIPPEEIERLRNLAVTAATIFCKWMIDTGVPAPGSCRCNLAECKHSESPIYRGLNPEKPFRWKSRLCNPYNCRFFEP
jgi:hypothetical protein